MSEQTAGLAASVAAGKALSFISLLGAGVLGGVLMAIFDPPKDRKTMFAQAVVAGIGSLFFGPMAVRAFDYYFDFVDITKASPVEMLQVAAPVYFVVGAMSWGIFGALAKLREILRTRGADTVADKLDLK